MPRDERNIATSRRAAYKSTTLAARISLAADKEPKRGCKFSSPYVILIRGGIQTATFRPCGITPLADTPRSHHGWPAMRGEPAGTRRFCPIDRQIPLNNAFRDIDMKAAGHNIEPVPRGAPAMELRYRIVAIAKAR
jgi:hypothetical protein